MSDRDRSCRRCGASAESRVESCGFGEVRSEVCGVCGAEVVRAGVSTTNPRSKRRRETRLQHEAERDLERATR